MMMWYSLMIPPDPALTCGWMTVELVGWTRWLMTRALSQSVSALNGLIHVLWGIYLLLLIGTCCFFCLFCFVNVNAHQQLVDNNIQLDCCWFDSDVYWLFLWGSCVCMAVENLWAAFCDVNQLNSGIMSWNSRKIMEVLKNPGAH